MQPVFIYFEKFLIFLTVDTQYTNEFIYYDDFGEFLYNFEQLLFYIVNRNPLFVLATGNFNETSATWIIKDQTSAEDFQTVSHTSFYGLIQKSFLHQITFYPFHLM